MRKRQRKRYKKGFTLVEMIGTITILGVVSLIALPVINNVSSDFTTRKFEMYEESLISAAKLYVDQNKEDLFGDANDGCSDVEFSEIISKNLVEDIELEGATCAGTSTYVRVQKKGLNYDYQTSITCTLDGKVVYKKTLPSSDACLLVDDIHRPGYVATSSSITSNPTGSNTPSKTKTTTILISDEKGFAPNVKIRYYWINTSNRNAVVGEKKEKDFKNALIRTSHTLRLDVSTPDTTGDLKLVVEPIEVVNGDGRQITGTYTSQVFKIDNTPPVVVIKAYQERDGNKTGGVIRQANNTNLVINEWKNHGYYFDFTSSYDNYGSITKETWKWNKVNNINMVENHDGGSSNYNSIRNTTFTGHGARYGTVTLCDIAGNCTSKNIKVNISIVYYIKYAAGGGGGSTSNTTCYYGYDCQLRNNNFSKAGHSFSNWNINGTNYNAGSNVRDLRNKEGDSVTATAQWNIRSYTVYYHVNDSRGYNGDWATRTVKYGEGIPTDLNPQWSIDEFRQFNGWRDVPGSMPDHDIRVNADIGDVMCQVVTGHSTYNHVSTFVPVFRDAGWRDVQIINAWEPFQKYYLVITGHSLTYQRAQEVTQYVWDHTPSSGANYLVWMSYKCLNGRAYTKCRNWGCG